MISESQLREFIARKSESRNLDYKERLNWNSASKEEKCEIVKDILAMLNTQDGGCIVLGVRDETLELVGLSQDDFASFDTTSLNDFLQRYTDPVAACDVQKFTIDGLRVVVLSVLEFQDVPIICKKDANSSSNPSKLILKAGGLYIRSEKAASELVSSAENMRGLMGRALLKKGDQLLSTIEALLKGKPVANEERLSKYSKEIEAAHAYFKETLPAEVGTDGYWELRAMPEVYQTDRLPDTASVINHLIEARVALRGWDFPHTDDKTKSNFASGRQSYTNFAFAARHIEAYRAYRSGLFVWRGGYREDGPQFNRDDLQGSHVLSFVNVIYTVTEMFVFLKRYYARVAEDAVVHVSLEMRGIKNRRLIALGDAILYGDFVSVEPDLTLENDYSVSELRASAEEHAISIIKRIFELFNWNGADPNTIRMWQQRLLSRTS